MKNFVDSLRIGIGYLPRLLFRHLQIWIPLILISCGTTLIVDALTEQARESSTPMIIGFLIQAPVELLSSLIITTLVCIRLNDWIDKQDNTKVFRILLDNAKPLTIESLRTWASILLGFILFVIPGFYQIVRLSFVPFIVLFDRRYQNGEVDALAESASLTKGLKRYLVVLLFSGFAVELLTEWLRKSIFEPGLLATFTAVTLRLVCDVYFQSSIFIIYKKRSPVPDNQA